MRAACVLWGAIRFFRSRPSPLQVTFVSTFRDANPGVGVEGQPNVLYHSGMFPDSTVYRCG